MNADSITTENKAKRNTFYCAKVVCLLLAVAAGFPANAQTADGSCEQLLKEAHQKLQQAQSQFSTCRSVKRSELEIFNAKRARFLRLRSWASNLEFAASLRPYIDSLNERDRMLTSKAEEFEACMPVLRDVSIVADTPVAGQECEQTLAAIEDETGKFEADLNTCQACSLGIMGEGINKSAMEILIVQQKDARVLREALYQQLTSDYVGDLSALNQWLVTRDVFLAYITDTANKLSNTQTLIVMLQQLEQKLVALDAPNEYTDQVMEVYRQLASTLQSKPKKRREQTERLWQMFTAVVPEYHVAAAKPGSTGFDEAIEMAQRFNAMAPQERDTLVSVISTAVKKYQPYRQPS